MSDRARRRLLLLSILMLVLLAEAGSSIFNFAPGPRVIAFHESLGWLHVPGVETVRNEVLIRINPNGLRDEDHSYAKSPGTYRVLFLGDSFVEVLQVPVETAVSERLEELLVAASRTGPSRSSMQGVRGTVPAMNSGFTWRKGGNILRISSSWPLL